jgi:hypothetical protein
VQSKGLSIAHNSPQEGVSPQKQVKEKSKIRIAEGGKLLQVTGQKTDSSVDYPHGRKAVIKDFTRGSRGRLLRVLASINEFETGLPDFLTITYPGEYSIDWRRWKRDLDALNKAMVRRWPSVWGVWRLEFQKRGAPHFHFLLFDGPGVIGIEMLHNGKNRTMPDHLNEHNQEVFKWISETWFRIVGSGDERHLNAGTRIEPIQSWNGVTFYSSKYLAKLPEGKGFVPQEYNGTGRFWGRIGLKRWKVSIFEKEVGEPLFFKIKRVLRKMYERKTGKKARSHRNHGITAFVESSQSLRLLVWAWEETGGDCPF